MEIWERPPSSHYRHPSFSSTLLDQIYRSIDDSSPLDSTIIKKKKQQQQQRNTSLHEDRQVSPLFHRRSVAADFEGSRRRTSTDFLKHSNSGSSDSSGGFSSSEFDSKSSASPQQPKPIRTSSLDHSSIVQKPKELGGFLRTKSKALKIYSDLKKVKQPISPGGRLATFLNSLFTNAASATKPKKTKTVSSSCTSTTTTTCSSASSFSRSCLSKTPSSSSKSKRSVRFCPVNVILDEDTSSSVHIPYPRLYNNNEPKRDVVEEHRRVIEAAKDLLRTYHNNKMTSDDTINVEEENYDDDDDDAVSCASSDLFELENLSAIGIERYREELPVYETTRLDNTNRAIATRYIV